MQALLEHLFITQSTLYSLIAVLLVAFPRIAGAGGVDFTRHGTDGGLGALIVAKRRASIFGMLAGSIIGCLMGDCSFVLAAALKSRYTAGLL